MESRKLAQLGLAASVILMLLPTQVLAQTTHIVTVGDNFFSPSNLTIQVGDTVEWRNASGGNQHNVTANNGAFASATASSFTFSQTFNFAGTVNYRCTVHGSGMSGVITVQGAATAPDIALQGVDAAAGTYAPGDSISIEIDLENIGNASSGAFDITYYASPNASITSSDIELGTDARPSLNAGQSSSFTGDADFPGNIASGNYFIGAIVDIDDSNNGNDVNHDPNAVTVQAPPPQFLINAGLNDTWFNPATAGQGFFITVFPDIEKMFLAWFTYDKERPPQDVTAMLGEPGHRWLTAFGDYSGDTATLDVELTQGGVFNTAPPAPTQGPDGTITVEFSDCNSGEVNYNIPSSNSTGSVDIQRIALDNVPFCESLQPD